MFWTIFLVCSHRWTVFNRTRIVEHFAYLSTDEVFDEVYASRTVTPIGYYLKGENCAKKSESIVWSWTRKWLLLNIFLQLSIYSSSIVQNTQRAQDKKILTLSGFNTLSKLKYFSTRNQTRASTKVARRSIIFELLSLIFRILSIT